MQWKKPSLPTQGDDTTLEGDQRGEKHAKARLVEGVRAGPGLEELPRDATSFSTGKAWPRLGPGGDGANGSWSVEVSLGCPGWDGDQMEIPE